MTGIDRLVEERIREASERGDFDDLPGRGRPLPPEDDAGCPAELRLAYHVLKNAGYLPPELEIRKEMTRLEDLLADCPEEKARCRALRRLNYLSLKLAALRPMNPLLEEHRYAARVAARLVKPPAGAA